MTSFHRQIRLLQLLGTSELSGGPQHVFEVVRRLDPDEFRVTVAAPAGGPYQDWLRAPGVTMVGVPLDGPASLLTLVRLARRLRIDLIHSHGAKAGLWGRLAGWWTGVPVVHTFHGLHFGERPVVQALRLHAERGFARLSAALVHVSASQALEAGAIGLAPQGKTHVIPNGVDVHEIRARLAPRAAARRALALDPGAHVLGCAARFERVKGLGLLVEAMRTLAPADPSAVLVLVGDGSEGPRLRHQIQEAGLADSVRFAGLQPDPVRFFSAFDVYASSSRLEGLPLAVLEAMAAGLPVVATRVGGHVDLVEPGRTGFLVPLGDARAFAATVVALFRSAPLRRALGRAGQERAERHFQAESMAAALIGLYRQVVDGNRGK